MSDLLSDRARKEMERLLADPEFCRLLDEWAGITDPGQWDHRWRLGCQMAEIALGMGLRTAAIVIANDRRSRFLHAAAFHLEVTRNEVLSG